jgi:hypothetical protein
MTENERQELALARAVARLRGGLMATVFGMTCGAALWIATAWLVVRGGPRVGQHLGLLRFYFPGYTVTWGGAFVGFFYGALLGALAGYLLAWIYNRLADWRAR